MRNINHFVDGGSWAGGSSRTADVFNPATGRSNGASSKLATKDDVEKMRLILLKTALPDWATTPVAKRGSSHV